MSIAAIIDSTVTYAERRIPWGGVWKSRLFGCAIGWMRIVEWTLSCEAQYWDGSRNAPGARFRLGDRFQLSLAMWCGRYWADWGVD